MTVSILTLVAGGGAAFMGQLFMWLAKNQEDAPAWLEYWGYVFFVFAVLLVIASVVELFTSIARAIRRKRSRRRGRR